VTKHIKEKSWCSHHQINTHASESCWVLHPDLRPSYLKMRAAQSAQQARVVPTQTGSSLSPDLGSALLSATKEFQSQGNVTMVYYYAEVVTIKCPHCMVQSTQERQGRRGSQPRPRGCGKSHSQRCSVLPANSQCAAGAASSEGACTSCGYGRAG
jgi:hypothetical protein